jgi:hypothetical protein
MYDAWKNEKVDLSGVGISAGISRQRQAEGHGASEIEGQLVEVTVEDVGSRWIVGLYQGQQSVPSPGSADCGIFYKDYGHGSDVYSQLEWRKNGLGQGD